MQLGSYIGINFDTRCQLKLAFIMISVDCYPVQWGCVIVSQFQLLSWLFWSDSVLYLPQPWYPQSSRHHMLNQGWSGLLILCVSAIIHASVWRPDLCLFAVTTWCLVLWFQWYSKFNGCKSFHWNYLPSICKNIRFSVNRKWENQRSVEIKS